MKRLHRAHLIVAAVLVSTSLGAASSRVAAASVHPAPGLYLTNAQGFDPPAAAGETTASTSTAATDAAEPVEGAPQDTGIEDQE